MMVFLAGVRPAAIGQGLALRAADGGQTPEHTRQSCRWRTRAATGRKPIVPLPDAAMNAVGQVTIRRIRMNSDSDYLTRVDQALLDSERLIERDFDMADCARSGRVLTIEFPDGARIVANAQAPTRQLWLASRLGARHFALKDERWLDMRTGEEYFAVLAAVARAHAG
jgi:CyaY protein